MAIKKTASFFLPFVGDGVSTSFSANLITDPFQYGASLAPGFSPTTPDSVRNLSCQDHGIEATLSGSVITFTISSGEDDAPDFVYADGANGQVQGDLVFG